MRRSLGRVILIIIALHSLGWGMISYQWKILEIPQSLKMGQTGMIRVECAYNGNAMEYTSTLKTVDNEKYTTSILSENSKLKQGKQIDTIELLVTPKVSGTIEVPIEAVVKYTRLGLVEYSAHYGRDNVSKGDIVEKSEYLPLITIHSDENSASLSGKITFTANVDHTSVRAHEPIHLSIYIKGSGSLDKFVPFDLNITGVKIFAEQPQKTLTPAEDGFRGEIRQEFALVAEKNFIIPPLTLTLFDTKDGKIKTLTTTMTPIKIEEGYAVGDLLDTPNLSDYSSLKRYGRYIALIIFGMILGEGLQWLWKHRMRRKSKMFWDEAKNTKSLIILLALSGEKRFEKIIVELETGVIGLSEAKKKLSTLTLANEVNHDKNN
ncbi:MAG: hypothetical protein PHO27_03610 [Sulfuricurvum sp.]|nr:hypothetical protein [Sulfuricurvum sp.]